MPKQRQSKTPAKVAKAGESVPTTAVRPGAHRNEKIGEVVSTKMAKTIVVEVTRRVPHPLYKRIVSRRKKFYAHDEQQVAKVGDMVRIVECRPLSRLKRWELATIIRRAVQVGSESALETQADTRTRKTVKKRPEAAA
jgi:small subunit ribosomal protein S17